MMNMKKLLALLLAVVMVLGMFPMGALADETEPELCTCGLVLNHDGECQSQEPAPQNLEEPELCTCGLEKGHEGECKTAEPEYCDCGLTKGHEGECKTAEPEYCDCGLEKGHEGDCKTAEPEYCDCGLTKGHEGDCKTAEPEYCDCGLTKGHEGECKKAEPEKCALCESTEHATNECSLFCGFCQKVPCECVVCEKCSVKNGHTDQCELKPCEDCKKNPCECGVFADLNEKEDFDTFYATLLEKVNDETALEDLMALSTEQIFALLAKAETLYAAITEPSEQQKLDMEDILGTCELLPNYREKCVECGEYPCVCKTDAECNCGAESDADHTKECPAYFIALYERIMRVNTVNDLLDITSKMTEGDEGELRQWLKDNGLYEDYATHVDNLMRTAAVGTPYPAIKNTLPRSTGTVTSDALKMAKSATYNSKTGMYDIVLETYTTGVVEEGQILPADTVLVLDVSGSMDFEYYQTRIGTPMYGDYFKHSSGNYWGWYENSHLINGKNPYVKLPNGSFAEAAYVKTDSNNVEIFKVVSTGETFYPVLLCENFEKIPRQYTNYPVYQLYKATATERYLVTTGIPIFGGPFTYNSQTWYGWLGDSHEDKGGPYVQLADGSFTRAYYRRSDTNRVEIFAYKDSDTEEYFEFYPRLKESCNGITRSENLPVLQLCSGYNNTRMPALLNAVAEFLRITAEKNASMPAGSKSRIAMVQFSCNTASHTTQPTKVIKQFTDVTSSNLDDMISFTYGITDGGARTHTEIGKGMELAENLLSAVTRTSHKAVIAFTDGYPEADDADGWGQANRAIASAKRITDAYKASIYSVCIQDDAVVRAGSSLPGNSANADKINRFMHLLSSNYPGASSMTSTGTGSTNSGYYLVPGSEGDLTSIFSHIGEQIGDATINLDSTTKVFDEITPYFAMPAGATVNISVKDAVYSGNTLTWKDSTMNTSGIKYSVDETGKQISVTGFNYNHNFVASTGRQEGNVANPGDFFGRKLVIKFSVAPNEDFLGGDGVPTNTTDSGVYTADGTPIAKFDVPTISVPVSEITPDFTNGAIYVSQEAEIPHVTNIGAFTQSGRGWNVDGTNNGFVDIIYTVQDAAGNTLSYTIPARTSINDLEEDDWTGNMALKQVLTEDKLFTVTCTVTSTGNSNNKKSHTENKTIYVYKPVIVFQDSRIDLGDPVDYETQNYPAAPVQHIEWVNTAADKDYTTELGTAPTLQYTYEPLETAAFTKDTKVKVTNVNSPARDVEETFNHKVPQNMDIFPYTTFKWLDNCTFPNCGMHGTNSGNLVDVNRGETNFIVHLNTFDIKIEKTGWNALEPGQSYIFNVIGPNGSNIDLDVMINKNGHVILKGVPVGTYTVKEDTNWSWRYDPKGGAEKIVSASSAVDGMATVTFENERNDIYWLDGNDYANNEFGKAS